jgi:hypothetical protein
VTPGKPEESYLLDLLKAPDEKCHYDRMPAGGADPLSARALAEVSAWIEAGAPTTESDVGKMSSDSSADAPTDDSASSETDTSADEAPTDTKDGPSTDAGSAKR